MTAEGEEGEKEAGEKQGEEKEEEEKAAAEADPSQGEPSLLHPPRPNWFQHSPYTAYATFERSITPKLSLRN